MQNYEMKKWERVAIIIIFILLLIIVGFSTSTDAQDETQEMLSSIEERVDQIHQQSIDNMEKMTYVESLVVYLEEDMEEYEEKIDSLQEENEEQKKRLFNLEDLIEQLKEKLDQSEKQVELKKVEKKPEIIQASAQKPVKKEPVKEPEKQVASSQVETYEATAYDLSVQSCGKPMSHPQYGVTRSGFNISGMNRREAMTIAVDPSVIPLGSKVKVEVENPKWEHFNGVYTARDTGGAIKGKKIDIFMGDFGDNYDNSKALQFGRQRVKISIVK